MTQERVKEVTDHFRRVFGSEPQRIVRAPGRVELLGNHTDYNEGFVLPAALDLDVMAAGSLRNDDLVSAYSANFDTLVEFPLSRIEKDLVNTWSNYVRGVLKFLGESGVRLQGVNMAISGNVPVGSGLSSSAAIEMAVGFLMQALVGFEMSGPDLALIGQRAENEFVGVSTGIMDQFVSRLGKKDHALFLDCRTLCYEHVPLETRSIKIVVCDTMKRRGLVDSEYDQRRAQCEEAVRLLSQWIPNVRALRDVSKGDFELYKDRLPEVIRKRAQHVIYENERVLKSREVLNAGDYESFARLLDECHESARDLYEVSCAELDTMVEICRQAPGAMCARLTGAGFGGCTVSLVRDEHVDAFVNAVKTGYAERTGVTPAIYVCTAEDGASIVQ
ncbi:MAG: galactokinase [Armatimonadota bacterium]|nr:galactokinase [Armatimonadota bacterium]